MCRSRTSFTTILTIIVGCLLSAAHAADHPTLVDVASTDCTGCHDDLWDEGATLHPPVADDCASCHEFSRTEEGTEVALMAEGVTLCVVCHDALEAAAEGSLEVPHDPVTDACTTCHNPHGSANPKLLEAPAAELCAGCHDEADLEEPHDGQLTAAVSCQACHNVHGSDNPRMLLASQQHMPFAEGSCSACHRQPLFDRIRLRSRGERLCAACHGEFEEQEAGGSVHAALKGERGRAGCLSCHDPHMSSHPTLLTAAGPEVCRQCHTEVVAAALGDGGHPPAADDCLSCHLPHVADQHTLLQAAPEELCAMCHDTADADLAASHLGADLEQLACTACHSPHGSEHPTLLAANIHPPVLDGCDTCHDERHDALHDETNALCGMCHDDVAEAAAAAKVPHAALEMGSCTDCHNPHASAQDKLVKAPGAGPCADCHDEQVAGPDEFAHGIIDVLGCRACHEPHGGSNETMLRQTGSDLCLACHDPQGPRVDEATGVITLLGRFEIASDELQLAAMTNLRLTDNGTQNHPVTNHRTVGTPTHDELKRSTASFVGELTCLTCHDPHKGRSQGLFRWNAASAREACAHCHDQ